MPNFAACRAFVLFASFAITLPAQIATLQITRTPSGPAVPKDFIGLSVQQSVALTFFGPATNANTVLFALMKNLGVGTLRLGGNAGDYSCWGGEPAPAPSLCQYTLSNFDFDSWAYTSGQTGWPLILGLNLVQNIAPGAPQWSLDEVTKGIQPVLAKRPKASLLALELGNEINLYGLNPQYRPADYGVPGETSDLLSYIGALKGNAGTQSIPLAAPAYYNPSPTIITNQLDPLLTNLLKCQTCSPSNLGLITLHEYPLNNTYSPVTISQLLAPTLIQQIEGIFRKAVMDVQSMFTLRVQIDETNSTIPDPGQQGVSDVHAAAIWALDYALDMARIGIRRMNFHIHQGSFYNPIYVTNNGGVFSNQVQPEYYGMYAFLPAKGKTFLPNTLTTSANIRAYALSTCSTCAITVFLINKDLSASGTVKVSLSSPGTSGSYYELSAPTLDAPASSIKIGGAQFDNNTGLLSGSIQSVPVQPDGSGNYNVQLDNAAVGVLTIQP